MIEASFVKCETMAAASPAAQASEISPKVFLIPASSLIADFLAFGAGAGAADASAAGAAAAGAASSAKTGETNKTNMRAAKNFFILLLLAFPAFPKITSQHEPDLWRYYAYGF